MAKRKKKEDAVSEEPLAESKEDNLLDDRPSVSGSPQITLKALSTIEVFIDDEKRLFFSGDSFGLPESEAMEVIADGLAIKGSSDE